MDWQAVLRTIAGAAASGWMLIPLTPAAAQVPSPYKPSAPTTEAAQERVLTKATPADLEAVKLLLDGGQFEAALDAARALEPEATVVRLRIDAAIGLERPADALTEYGLLVASAGSEDFATLDRIARLVVRQALSTPDPLLVIQGCAALVQRGPDDCARPLTVQADDPKAPFALRIATLAALARTSAPGAAGQFQRLAATAEGAQWRSVVDASEGLPPAIAVPLLARALEQEDEGVQFAAAGALGGFRTPEARAALETYLQADRAGMPRGAARLSLARHGDDRWFKEFVAVLPELEGDMLLEMGLILRDRGDPRGVDAIARVAGGDHDMLRLAAAARLPPSSDLADRVLTEALDSDNPWTRAAALDEFQASPLLTVARARQFLTDVAPWVRVRAARVLFARMGPPGPAPPAKHP